MTTIPSQPARPSPLVAALLAAALLAAALLAAAHPAVAAEPARLRTLFPRQASVEAEAGRLVRLVLPPEVLAVCRPDLSDLRLFDAAGGEVPFLVDSGWQPERRLELERTFTPELGAVERSRTDRETGPSRFRESYTLEVPSDFPADASWELEVVTARPRFVKQVEVTAPGPGAATGERIGEGSVFRLTDPGRERTAVPLQTFSAARLTVVLEGEDGAYLEPVFRLRTGHSVTGRERAAVPLAVSARREEGGRTVVDLERPRGLVPDALRIATTTAAWSRPVEVWDEGPGSVGTALGRATLFRVQALTAVEEAEIPLAPARGDRLRVVIGDGDSPALADLAFSAVVRRPVLLFTLPEAAGAGAAPDAGATGGSAKATLLFGGARAFRPSYDLAALPPALTPRATGTAAEVAERLYDPAQVAEARLGPIAANPDFDPAPALAFAHHPGAELDARLYRFRRPLAARPSPEGLVRLRLAPEDLAQARPDLADLRIADGAGRQWAYLLERDAAEERQPADHRRSGERGRHLPLPPRPRHLPRHRRADRPRDRRPLLRPRLHPHRHGAQRRPVTAAARCPSPAVASFAAPAIRGRSPSPSPRFAWRAWSWSSRTATTRRSSSRPARRRCRCPRSTSPPRPATTPFSSAIPRPARPATNWPGCAASSSPSPPPTLRPARSTRTPTSAAAPGWPPPPASRACSSGWRSGWRWWCWPG